MTLLTALIVSYPARVSCDQPDTGAPYKLKVEQVGASASVDGPAPLSLTVTYCGKGTVTLRGLDPQIVESAVHFDAPKGWLSSVGGDTTITLNGAISDAVLASGASVSVNIDLKRFFAEIKAGKTALKVTLHISRVTPKSDERTGKGFEPVTLRATVPVVLTAGTGKARGKDDGRGKDDKGKPASQ